MFRGAAKNLKNNFFGCCYAFSLFHFSFNPSLLAADLEVYGEHSSWIFDVPATSDANHFEDSSLLRLRAFGMNDRQVLRPYLTLSGSRDRISDSDAASSVVETTKAGAGLHFAISKSPLQIFVEGRQVDEARPLADLRSNRREAVIIAVLSGETKPLNEHVSSKAAWYADLNHFVPFGGRDYDAASGWFRFSASMIGDSVLSITLDPIDLMAYRECLDGCRGWFFAGVGLSAGYSNSSLSILLRGSVGERFNEKADQAVRSEDAARLLLTFGGSF